MSFLSRAYGMTGVASGHMDAAHLVFFYQSDVLRKLHGFRPS